ncbi:hypothetical protein Peur_068038 [Populus x canadensis]
MDPALLKLFSCQSYTMEGEKTRKGHHCPMLIDQWQYAVTRLDMAETFSFKDLKEHGGNLVIPADRFLHDVAFKCKIFFCNVQGLEQRNKEPFIWMNAMHLWGIKFLRGFIS